MASGLDADGPTWDLLAQCEVHGQPGALLVEAKAHVSELDHGGRRPSKSISTQALQNSKRIDTSVAQCQRWLRAHGVPDASVSTKAHYQLVNRLSAATVLAECGLHVILMFLGFTGDTYFDDYIRDSEHWNDEIKRYMAIPLPGYALGQRLSENRGSGHDRRFNGENYGGLRPVIVPTR